MFGFLGNSLPVIVVKCCLLDIIVTVFYRSSGKQQLTAQRFLKRLFDAKLGSWSVKVMLQNWILNTKSLVSNAEYNSAAAIPMRRSSVALNESGGSWRKYCQRELLKNICADLTHFRNLGGDQEIILILRAIFKTSSRVDWDMLEMNLVEQYLYSLPEYRLELYQKNFIEIRSFNGLLSTKKVIGKFDFSNRELLSRHFIMHRASTDGTPDQNQSRSQDQLRKSKSIKISLMSFWWEHISLMYFSLW